MTVKTENAPRQQEAPQAEPSKSPEQEGQAARAELMTEVQKEHLKELQEQKNTLERKRVSLQVEAESSRQFDQTIWDPNKKPDESGIAGFAKGTIESEVEKEINNKRTELEKFKIDDANIGVIKSAAKKLIYEHFCRTGHSKATTESYVNRTLTPQMMALFENMNKILEDPKYGFKSPMDVLAAFSDFAKMDLISGGRLQEGSILSFLKLTRDSTNALADKFKQYLDTGL